MRLLRTAALAALLAVGLTACTGDDPEPDTSPGPAGGADRVVASTTWVGALARAAGATNVTVIAPANIPDQAQFQPTEAELAPAADAEHVLYAESDAFAAQLKSAAGEAHLVPVRPDNALPAIREEVSKLAEVFGTQATASRWLIAFETQATALSKGLQGVAPIPAFTAVAQAEVAQWAEFAGVKVVGTYGPAAVTPAQLTGLAAKKPKLLLANVHVPARTPNVPGAIRVDLVNYPGEDLNLYAVFVTNADRISGTFAK